MKYQTIKITEVDVKEKMRKKRLTVVALAKQLRLPLTSLHRILNNDVVTSKEKAQRIIKAVNAHKKVARHVKK